MEQEQASSSQLARQNSAQNPTPPSSSAATTASSPQNVAANGVTETQEREPGTNLDDLPSLEKENTSLPSLPNQSKDKAVAAVEENVVLVNTSPWTNLSRHAVTNEMVFGPIPDREYHEGFMRKAIEMAQLALDSDETPVGCVFVRDGEVIGRGINGTNASLNVSIDLLFFSLICFGWRFFAWKGRGSGVLGGAWVVRRSWKELMGRLLTLRGILVSKLASCGLWERSHLQVRSTS